MRDYFSFVILSNGEYNLFITQEQKDKNREYEENTIIDNWCENPYPYITEHDLYDVKFYLQEKGRSYFSIPIDINEINKYREYEGILSYNELHKLAFEYFNTNYFADMYGFLHESSILCKILSYMKETDYAHIITS